jgi:hypothetical protein
MQPATQPMVYDRRNGEHLSVRVSLATLGTGCTEEQEAMLRLKGCITSAILPHRELLDRLLRDRLH